MKRYFIFLFLAFSLITEPVRCKPLVAVGGQLPRWGIVGSDISVHGSPRSDSIITKNLRAGTVVRLHEISRPVGDWVMIEPAAWIPMKSICGR